MLTFFIIENVYKKRVYDKESRLLIVMVSVDFSNFKDLVFLNNSDLEIYKRCKYK